VAGSDWLTYDDFAGRVAEQFDVTAGGGPAVAMVLVEATQGSEPGGLGPDGQQRRQFSLVFRAATAQVWQQGVYLLTHPELGELELFLVPIGSDADGVRYEAAFA
jgi:hypothetical protein